VVSNWPVKPNIALNYLIAFVVGLVFSFIYVYITVEDGTLGFLEDKSAEPELKASMQQFKYTTPAIPVGVNHNRFQSPVNAQRLNYYHSEQPMEYKQPMEKPVGYNQEVERPKVYNQAATQLTPNSQNNVPVFNNQASIVPTDDLDLDIIIKSGSMANIFGNSNLKS
jgi:hypothetical protein